MDPVGIDLDPNCLDSNFVEKHVVKCIADQVPNMRNSFAGVNTIHGVKPGWFCTAGTGAPASAGFPTGAPASASLPTGALASASFPEAVDFHRPGSVAFCARP